MYPQRVCVLHSRGITYPCVCVVLCPCLVSVSVLLSNIIRGEKASSTGISKVSFPLYKASEEKKNIVKFPSHNINKMILTHIIIVEYIYIYTHTCMHISLSLFPPLPPFFLTKKNGHHPSSQSNSATTCFPTPPASHH